MRPDIKGIGIKDLKEMYDILFEMYVERIHEHRMGKGTSCYSCCTLAEKEVEKRLQSRIKEKTLKYTQLT